MGEKQGATYIPVERLPFAWRDAPLSENTGIAHWLDSHFERLAKSPTFMAMMQTTPELQNVATAFNEEIKLWGHYCHSTRKCEIRLTNTWTDKESVLVLMAHEYRHAWQHKQGIFLYRKKPAPREHHLIFSRAVESDADTFGMTVMQEIAREEKFKPGRNFQHPRWTRLKDVWDWHQPENNPFDESGQLQKAMFLDYLSRSSETRYRYDKEWADSLHFIGIRQEFGRAASPEQRQEYRRNLTQALCKFGDMPFLKDGEVQRRNYMDHIDLDRLVENPAMRKLGLLNRARLRKNWLETLYVETFWMPRPVKDRPVSPSNLQP